jgi:hypothetical protein
MLALQVPSFFLVLPNDLPETFSSAQACCSIIVCVCDPWIGVMQDGAAEMGIVARMEGRGGDCGRAKHVRSEWHAHGS